MATALLLLLLLQMLLAHLLLQLRVQRLLVHFVAHACSALRCACTHRLASLLHITKVGQHRGVAVATVPDAILVEEVVLCMCRVLAEAAAAAAAKRQQQPSSSSPCQQQEQQMCTAAHP
jgi:hypothetical protein